MSTYKPKNSRVYHYDFVFRGVRYHGSTGCMAKRDAERVERDRKTEVAIGEKVKKSITLDEACGILWANSGQFEKNAGTVKYQLQNLLDGFGAGKLLADISFLDVHGYIARRRGMKVRNRDKLVSSATVNREIELLRRVVRLVGKEYAVAEIEWRKLLLAEPKERVRELQTVEESRLHVQLDEDLAAMVEFAILSGQRKNEIVTLLWSNVDLGEARAKVRAKGGDWHTFPLTPRMLAIIGNRPKVAPQVFTYIAERSSPPRKDRPQRIKGERYPYSKQGWSKKWSRALKAAGIDDFRFHDLRHTAGSRVTRTSNLKVTQKLLGHTRIETTARYAHVYEDDIRAGMLAAEQSRTIPEASSVTVLKPAGRLAK